MIEEETVIEQVPVGRERRCGVKMPSLHAPRQIKAKGKVKAASVHVLYQLCARVRKEHILHHFFLRHRRAIVGRAGGKLFHNILRACCIETVIAGRCQGVELDLVQRVHGLPFNVAYRCPLADDTNKESLCEMHKSDASGVPSRSLSRGSGDRSKAFLCVARLICRYKASRTLVRRRGRCGGWYFDVFQDKSIRRLMRRARRYHARRRGRNARCCWTKNETPLRVVLDKQDERHRGTVQYVLKKCRRCGED